MKLFIICGKAGSGKTTIANMINEYCKNKNIKSVNLMYTETLKNYAKKITGWDGNENTKPRKFLQELGTNIIRNEIDKDFFVKRMIDDIKIYSNFFDVLTISDARFRNELEIPKKLFKDVITIKVESDKKSILTTEEQNHITENDLNNYEVVDYKIINNDDLNALQYKIYKILEEVNL